jgi:hypothetical protein
MSALKELMRDIYYGKCPQENKSIDDYTGGLNSLTQTIRARVSSISLQRHNLGKATVYSIQSITAPRCTS